MGLKSQNHIAIQTEQWYHLKYDLKCSICEIEYKLKIKDKKYIIDVYGENKTTIYLIEIGNVDAIKKSYLKSIKKIREKNVVYIHKCKSKKIAKKLLNQKSSLKL
jgi:hypothetical protein